MYARNELNVSNQLKDIIDNTTRGLDLMQMNFSNVNFSGANLSGTDLSNANLLGANLKNAIYSEYTVIEDKFKDQMKYEPSYSYKEEDF